MFIISTLLFLGKIPNQAESLCAGGDDVYSENYRFGDYVFNAKILENTLQSKAYLDFFTDNAYNFDSYTSCLPGNEKNIEEWQKQYPQISKDTADFHEFIYETALDAYKKIAVGGNPLPQNKLASLLSKEENKEAIDYLIFAKTCEPFVVQVEKSTWDLGEDEEETAKPDKAGTAPTIEQGIEQMRKAKKPIIQQRYAFQIVRLAYYSQKYEQTLQLFDQFFDKTEKNYLYYRALLHKGFALRKLKKVAEANYCFSLVYGNEPSLKCIAAKNFYYAEASYETDITEEQWQKTLTLTKNDKEKFVLYFMRDALQNQLNVANFEGIFKTTTDADLMHVLLLKQLKYVENTVFLPALKTNSALDSAALTYGDSLPAEKTIESKSWWKGFWDAIANFFKSLFGSKEKSDDKKVSATTNAKILYAGVADSQENVLSEEQTNTITQLEEITLQMAEKFAGNHKALDYLVAAYLQLMKQDFSDANKNIDLANQLLSSKPDTTLQKQATYLAAFSTVLENDQIDEQVENELLPLMKDLKNLSFNQQYLLFNELGRRYLKNNQLTKAILATGNAYGSTSPSHLISNANQATALLSIYANQQDLENMIAFLKSSKTDFEKLLLKNIIIEENDIVSVQVTKLIVEQKFAEAKQKLSLLKASEPSIVNAKPYEGYFWASNNAISFTELPSVGYPYKEPDSKQFEQVSRYDFFKKVIELSQKVQSISGDEQAKIFMQLGCGFYYSNDWHYDIFGTEISPVEYPFNVANFSTHYHNKAKFYEKHCDEPFLATHFFAKAAEVAKDRNMIATALFYAQAAANDSFMAYKRMIQTQGIYKNYEGQIEGGEAKYFQKLKEEYADTEAFKDFETRCSYLRDFK
ncbi:MAG: hypothetical protein EAZ08_02230 [Cytophagales bacterium]|nr:MAG: hypothetical protein EAZ08_02230 [Cytophagales bacterium]